MLQNTLEKIDQTFVKKQRQRRSIVLFNLLEFLMQKILRATERKTEFDLGQPGSGYINLDITGERSKKESLWMDISGLM